MAKPQEILLCMFNLGVECEEWNTKVCDKCGWHVKRIPGRQWELEMALTLYPVIHGHKCKDLKSLHETFNFGGEQDIRKD